MRSDTRAQTLEPISPAWSQGRRSRGSIRSHGSPRRWGSPRVHCCLGNFMGRKTKYDWERADWSLGDYQIAGILGCHGSLVTRKRKSLEIEPTYGKPRICWPGTLDWRKSDLELAKEVGVSGASIAARRRFLGIAPAFEKGQKPPSLPLAEIDAKLSERKTVHEWLNKAKIPRKESGKPICLLRRLRICLDLLMEQKRQLKGASKLVSRLLKQRKSPSP